MFFNNSRLLRLVICFIALLVASGRSAAADTKEQRDARMAWWREARFGMFIHWGPYAVLAGEYDGKKIPGLGEWIMYDAQDPRGQVRSLRHGSSIPVKFNADQWAAIVKAAGMKYLVITAKHCDGFAMYSSKASKYNIADATPFRRDPMAELAKACAAQGISLCFYYSHCWDWHEPNAPGFINDWDFGPMSKRNPDVYFRGKSLPQVEELVSQYKPALDVVRRARLDARAQPGILEGDPPARARLRRQRPRRQRSGRLSHARAVHSRQRFPRPRLGDLHDDQRHLGLQIVRQ